MKVEVEKNAMVAAVRTVIRSVASNSPIPAMTGILLQVNGQKMKLTGYNGSMAMQSTVEVIGDEDGDIVLDARLLMNIVSSLDGNSICIKTKDATALISCGDAHFSVSYIAGSDFPELPEITEANTVSVPQKALKAMTEETLFATTENEAKPMCMGPQVEIRDSMMSFVTTDGYRVAIRKESIESTGVELKFNIPSDAIAEVAKLCGTGDTVDIAVNSTHVMFSVGDFVVITRQLSGEFLNYNAALPRVADAVHTYSGNAKALLDAIARVSIVTTPTIKRPMMCDFGDNVLKISCESSLGASKDSVKLEGSCGGDAFKIAFNPRFLADAIKFEPDDEVKILMYDPAKPVLIVPTDGSDRFKYAVLPVRIH